MDEERSWKKLFSKKKIPLIICLVFAVSIIVLGFFSRKTNGFWDLSIGQIITYAIAIVFAFYITQIKSDERKRKEHVERLILEIQDIVTDPSFYRILKDENYQTIITVRNRKVNNYIDLIVQYGTELGFKRDADYISKEFKDYKDFVSDHIADYEYLQKSEKQLNKYSENINSKCDSIIFLLYR